jgi:hypothetical protein
VPLDAVNQMTIPAVVAALAEADRAAETAGADEDDPLAEFRILKVTQVAKLFAINAGVVSKRCDDGTYVTNGLTGHDRRIDVLSVIRQQLEQLAKQASPDAE